MAVKRGGIFAGYNVLGRYDQLGEYSQLGAPGRRVVPPRAMRGFGASGEVQCDGSNTSLVTQIQAYLKANGAPNVHTDGSWEGCTARAWQCVMGRPMVYGKDITNITGQTCNSASAAVGDIIPAFTMTDAMACNDNTDGCTNSASGGTQGCPPNQCYSTTAGMCVANIIAQLTGGCAAGSTTVQTSQAARTCPAGTTYEPNSGACLPSGVVPTGVTAPSGGSLFPGEIAPSVCASGMVTNPVTGKCSGNGSVEVSPTECANGQIKNPIDGGCLPFGTTGTTGTTASAGSTGTCGLTNPLACISSLFGGGSSSSSTGTTAAGTCASGSISLLGACVPNPLSAISSMFSAVTGKTTTTPTGTTTTQSSVLPASMNVFGDYSTYVWGALAIGAAAVAWHFHKKHQEEQAGGGFGGGFGGGMDMGGMDEFGGGMDMGGMDEFGGGMDEFGGGMDEFGGEYAYPNKRRRHAKKGKARRRSRHCR